MKKSKFSLAHKDPATVELMKTTDHRTLAAWARNCAERVMPYFEQAYPHDNRPRHALETLQAWLDTGVFMMAVIRRASLDSHAAARDVSTDNPARSAAHAAGQAVATAHVPTHAIGAANYALQGIHRASSAAEADSAVAHERAWQYQHLLELRKGQFALTPRTLTRSAALFAQAQQHLAGGVSSDARRSVQPVPLYVSHASGARLWDVDENEYLDYVLGQGPLVLGHGHPAIIEAVKTQLDRGQVFSAQHELEIEVAAAVCRLVPCAERLRFNSVGSEAMHAAWRLARAFTGREKILKFEGHYHGWFDSALYSVAPRLDLAGPPEAPVPVPGTRGQARSTAADLVIAPWNDLDALAALLERHGAEIAAVCMEPILCNTGCIAPAPRFLEGAQALCRQHGCLLIFDEVITGFRVALGGAQSLLGVTPDLAVFGKALAGGFPLSCLAGRAEVMDLISRGEVGHAGTFNSNPVVMAAAAATLRELETNAAEIYPRLTALGQRLMAGVREAAATAGIPLLADGPGPVFSLYLTEQPAVHNYRDFARCDLAGMARLHQLLLDHSVNCVGRGLFFLSAAHTDRDVDQTVAAFAAALDERKAERTLP